jgi:predicted DNA-binding transcriptional regulator AlpA
MGLNMNATKDTSARTMGEGKALLSMGDLTERLNISRAQVYRMIRKGSFPLPDFRGGPKLMRWRDTTVSNWLDNCHAVTK